ncbi:MAG TPA: DUF4244 domain-containing protein [Jatrophihabitans sp.]|uniref:DUF4244 domain-containing protein n=1 Tax=Jatrophihabitans sp. TaxID=1932789 RepID=UPI002F1FCDF3
MSIRRTIRRAVNRVHSSGGADHGMTTAEYAVGTVAAVAFAAVLFKVVHSQAVQTALSHIVTSALNVSL